MIPIVIFCLLLSLYFLLQLQLKIIFWLFPSLILSTLYTIPFRIGNTYFRFRDIPFIKIIIITIAIIYITVFIPLFVIEQNYNVKFIYFMISKFFFVFALTIPFDLRDLKLDKLMNVKTIPFSIGVKKSIYLSQFLLLISLLILVYICINFKNFDYWILIIEILVYLLAIRNLKYYMPSFSYTQYLIKYEGIFIFEGFVIGIYLLCFVF